jgi:hypothetical protein
MATARYAHTASVLANGKVLVAGGYGSSGRLASAVLYDPVTGSWSATGSMATARYLHTASVLANGKVLVAGGYGSSGSLASAELYDPVTGSWSPTGNMATARWRDTASVLANGKVLVAGGGPGALASAELYDLVTGSWSVTGSMVTARCCHTASVLANGKVLVAGGYGSSASLASAELYTPESLPPATVVLSPTTATNPVGTSHTLTATVSDASNQPVPNATVQFTVTGSVSRTGSCVTNSAGQCTFTYQGPTMPGHDQITGCAGPSGTAPCGAATKSWVCGESDGNGNFQGNNGNGDMTMDNDNCEEAGQGENGDNQGDRVDSSDRGDHKDFHSTKVESTKFDAAANTVTITGEGLSGGIPVSFTLVALETGNGGPGWVSWTFSDGFTNAGNLVTGAITLH